MKKPRNARLHFRRAQIGNAARPELAAGDRRPLNDGALVRLQPIETCSEKGAYGRRHRKLVTGLDEHRRQLFHEERITARHLRDPSGTPAASDPSRQLLRIGLPERLEQDRRCPRRPFFEELGTREAEKHDWTGCSVAKVFEQVEQRRLGPVDVLDDEYERPLAGNCLKQPSQRPKAVRDLHRVVVEADRRCDSRCDERGILQRGERGDLRSRSLRWIVSADVGEAPNKFADRPERDPFAVRQAAPGHDLGLFANRGTQLAREARLADAGGADDRDEIAPAIGDGAVESSPQRFDFALPTHDRGVRPRRQRPRSVCDLLEAPERDRQCFSFHLPWVERLSPYGVSDEPVGALAQ